MLNKINSENFEREKLDPIAALIELYTNRPEEYIALSLAFCAHCYDFGYNNYRCYIANKRTPLTKTQKRILKPYTEPEEDSAKYIFDADKVCALLKEIKKTIPSSQADSLEKALMIFEKYTADVRFIRKCNEGYLAIREEIAGHSGESG